MNANQIAARIAQLEGRLAAFTDKAPLRFKVATQQELKTLRAALAA